MLGLHFAHLTSLVQKSFDLFWVPSWIECWGDSSSMNWRVFANSTEECPTVEVAHFVCVRGVNSVVGWDKESMASALRVEGSHNA